MSTLESIVLSLADSQALVKAGVVLDTALVWVNAPQGWINGGGASLDVATRKVTPIPFTATGGYANEVRAKGGVDSLCWVICPAPALSELLDVLEPSQSSTASMVALAHALIALHDEVKP